MRARKTRRARGSWAFGLLALCVTHSAAAESTPSALPSLNADWLRPLDAGAEALSLETVLRTVDRHLPKLEAARAKLRGAQGKRLAASGGFDPIIDGKVTGTGGGYYDLLRGEATLTQPTPWWGLELSGGYRIGLGIDDERRFPTYYDNETLGSGEVHVAAELPLWRDGRIDARRAELRARTRLLEAAHAGLGKARLSARFKASRAFYNWVAAAHRLHIGDVLLKLAEVRQAALEARARSGAVSDFEVIANRQMVLERQDKRIALEQYLRSSGVKLSLYLRDAEGRPRVPQAAQSPALYYEASKTRFDVPALSAQLVRCHPEVRQRRAELRAQRTRKELADNQVAPDLRASLKLSRDLGDPDRNVTLPGTVLQAGLKFSMPALLRKSRGEAAALAASLERKRAELTWLEDQLRAAVRAARVDIDAAEASVRVAHDLAETSTTLAAGERKRFEAGSSTLLAVNLREQAAADAAQHYFTALAQLQALHFEWRTLTELSCEAEKQR